MATLVLFGAATISDGADGFLAKRYGWQSDLGALLDPVADKILLVTVLVTLAWLKLVPAWLMAVAVARDMVIVLGAVCYRILRGPLQLRPTLISKINTLCQVLFILSVIANERFARPPAWCVMVLGAIVFLTVVISGIDYVLTYSRLAALPASPLRPT